MARPPSSEIDGRVHFACVYAPGPKGFLLTRPVLRYADLLPRQEVLAARRQGDRWAFEKSEGRPLGHRRCRARRRVPHLR